MMTVREFIIACRQDPKWLMSGWLLGKFVGLFTSLMIQRPCVLLIISGSLGDGLLLSGAIREIRRQKPKHKITLVTFGRAHSFLQRCPHVDVIISFPMGCGLRNQLSRFIQASRIFAGVYEMVLSPNDIPGDPGNIIAILSVAGRRVRMKWGTLHIVSTCQGHENVSNSEAPSSLHELDRIVYFLREAGFKGVRTRHDIWPESYVSDSERAQARAEVESLGGHAPGTLIIAVCPGARFKHKDWGVDNFIALLRQISTTRRVAVHLLGGVDDKPVTDAIQWGLSRVKDIAVSNKAGAFGLHAAIALIEQSDLCIGNDTFGLHAAIAVGTPSIVIMWGGDDERWIPWGDPMRHRMVRSRDQSCFGCQGQCRWTEYRCMTTIKVEDVVAEVQDILTGMKNQRNSGKI